MKTSDIYKEACSLFSHYSRSSLMVRITAIAQGVVIISASGYLFKNSEYLYSSVAAAFGIIFSIILLFLHQNYQKKCETILKTAIAIEELIENPKFMVLARYADDHNHRNKTLFGEMFVINGLFTLLLSTFLVLFIGSLCMH